MTLNLLKTIGCLLCVALLAACASSNTQALRAGTTRAVTATDKLPAPDSTANSGAYVGISDYRIGPLDLIEISVFQVPDLNRTVRVNSAGQISLPLVGAIMAGGKTVQELEQVIGQAMTEGFLQNPQVSVFVKEFASQRITVEGAVRSPGIFPLTGRTSLLQAIAIAGGTSDMANLQGIVVFRVIEGKKMAAVFDLKAIRAGQVTDPQVYGDDIVVIDESGPRSTMHRIIQSLPILNLFTVL